MKSILLATAAAFVLNAAVQTSHAEVPAGSANPGIVSHIKVLSDKVEDVSSMEAWKKSFIKDGMSDEEKALAIWNTVVKFRHQHNPPNEYLEDDNHIHDPIKDYNVYGYGQCCCASANVEALSRYIGMETRGWGINNHSVPEIKIDGKWSLLDGSLVQYFKLPDGKIAGVMEISDSVVKWLNENPKYKKFDDHQQYYAIMRKGEWKKIGPDVLKGSATFDDNGWQPAHTHAWGDTIFEYGSTSVPIKDAHKPFLFEYGVALGYQVNVQLRPGEKLIRNWSNKGLHVNGDNPKSSKYILTASAQDPKSDLRYAARYGDLADGRAGNGTLEYDLPLASGLFRAGMLTVDNIAVRGNTGDGPAVRVEDPAKPAAIIFRMPSSYVYLSGELTFSPVVGNGGSIDVSFSDNNGLDWKKLASVSSSEPQKIDLTPLTYRRYDYRLKFDLKGAGTGLNAVKVSHDIQHSQRVLPILDKGETKISFSAGPQEGTVTVQGNITTDPAKARNIVFGAFHPTLENVDPIRLKVHKGTGTVSVPVETPGDISRIRIGAFWRAVTAEDKWTVEASFDAGKTFAPITTLAGPNIGNSAYVTFDKVPAGARNAIIRLTGNASANERLWMQQLRIDADYKEPHGGFIPVKVTYAYEENGEAKTDVHVAKSPEETYTIKCDTKPKMKSITLEVAE